MKKVRCKFSFEHDGAKLINGKWTSDKVKLCAMTPSDNTVCEGLSEDKQECPFWRRP